MPKIIWNMDYSNREHQYKRGAIVVVDAELFAFFQRDAPGACQLYEPPKAEPEAKEIAEPPKDKAMKRPTRSKSK